MTPPARSLPQATESVCPVCLRRIPAEYVLDPAEEGCLLYTSDAATKA